MTRPTFLTTSFLVVTLCFTGCISTDPTAAVEELPSAEDIPASESAPDSSEDEIAALEAVIAELTARVDANEDALDDAGAAIDAVSDKASAAIDRAAALEGRAFALEVATGGLEARADGFDAAAYALAARADDLEARAAVTEAEIDGNEARIAGLQADVDDVSDLIEAAVGPVAEDVLGLEEWQPIVATQIAGLTDGVADLETAVSELQDRGFLAAFEPIESETTCWLTNEAGDPKFEYVRWDGPADAQIVRFLGVEGMTLPSPVAMDCGQPVWFQPPAVITNAGGTWVLDDPTSRVGDIYFALVTEEVTTN